MKPRLLNMVALLVLCATSQTIGVISSHGSLWWLALVPVAGIASAFLWVDFDRGPQ